MKDTTTAPALSRETIELAAAALRGPSQSLLEVAEKRLADAEFALREALDVVRACRSAVESRRESVDATRNRLALIELETARGAGL